MERRTKKRVLGLIIGLAYGLVFGLLAAMATGGGHGNFVWIFMYIVPLVGPIIYFPIIGFLAADLRSFMSRIVFVGLQVAHYLTLLSLTVFPSGEMAEDNAKMLSRDPGGAIIMVIAYVIGQVPLVLLFVRSLLVPASEDEAGESTNLSIFS